MKKKPKVAIIISTYSQDKLLEKNIETIKKKNSGENYKIYLVDDASDNSIGKRIKKKFPLVRVIINKMNKGFSKSNNIGIKKAKEEYNPDWFLIYNDDCEFVEDNFLKKLIEKTKAFPKTGLFGCKLIYPDGSMQWGVKNNKTYFFEKSGVMEKDNEFSKIEFTNQVIGAFMFIKKEVFEEVGIFDENFSPFYGEESDLCFRILKKGWDITYFGNFKIIHHRNKSISKLTKDDVWFIRKKNSIMLERKHYPFMKRNYFLLIHFGSIFKKDGISFFKKLKMLFKAYVVNVKKLY